MRPVILGHVAVALTVPVIIEPELPSQCSRMQASENQALQQAFLLDRSLVVTRVDIVQDPYSLKVGVQRLWRILLLLSPRVLPCHGGQKVGTLTSFDRLCDSKEPSTGESFRERHVKPLLWKPWSQLGLLQLVCGSYIFGFPYGKASKQYCIYHKHVLPSTFA